jgi:hypothetical protein
MVVELIPRIRLPHAGAQKGWIVALRAAPETDWPHADHHNLSLQGMEQCFEVSCGNFTAAAA